MKAIEQQTLKFIKENNLIQENDNILVAFSGGPDSVFLLSILKKFSNLLKIEVTAAHINHNLRGNDSDNDQEFCHSFCNEYKINCYSRSVDVNSFSSKNKLSVEEAARELRYNALRDISKKCDCSKIATAHNLGDNSETMFLNFIKGTGLTGLKGIPIKRDNIIRPILGINKPDILEYLADEEINFVTDASNFENDFQRNYLRNEIIPKLKEEINPGLEKSLLNTAQIFNSVDKLIDSHLRVFIDKFAKIEKNSIIIKEDFFISENSHLFGELLKRVVKSGLNSDLSYSDVKSVVSLAENLKGSRNYLSGKLLAVREKGAVVICKFNETTLPPPQLVEPDNIYKIYDNEISLELISNQNIKFSSGIEYIDFSKIIGDSFLRPWCDGDKFIPLGMSGFKKVADFLSEQNVSSGSKREKLVLENNGNIVLVLGYRIDDRYKIGDETEEVLKVRIIK